MSDEVANLTKHPELNAVVRLPLDSEVFACIGGAECRAGQDDHCHGAHSLGLVSQRRQGLVSIVQTDTISMSEAGKDPYTDFWVALHSGLVLRKLQVAPVLQQGNDRVYGSAVRARHCQCDTILWSGPFQVFRTDEAPTGR
ncbi:hypothetical protein RvY_02948-1 [Ramazzottius varieornatus]|uniref:Uncharacterized protein n=1 Tax=Ramazzottius varieornatus TaxID=947166 RepID=A0A1D1ULE7_RAMVA|nr:hypothetical protein RvY_02948-1 [Ramazzottius varieornatus]